MLAEAGDDAARLKAEIGERLEAVRSPFRTAESFLVEDVVDPADTRPLLDFYRERGILVPIDAGQPVDAVSDAIFRALRS